MSRSHEERLLPPCNGLRTSMTQTPRLLPRMRCVIRANSPISFISLQTARFLQLLICTVFLAVPSCAVPPSLQLDPPDARENAAPLITSVSNAAAQELVEPGPVTLVRGRGTLSVSLRDIDVSDTLFVRLYVDYNRPDPTPARASCSVAPGSTVARTATCSVGGVCTAADIGEERLLWIEVFDRELLDSSTPLFRAMVSGGASSKWQYFMRCQDQQ